MHTYFSRKSERTGEVFIYKLAIAVAVGQGYERSLDDLKIIGVIRIRPGRIEHLVAHGDFPRC